MPQTPTMTLHEKLEIAMQSAKLRNQGKKDEAIRLMIEKIPMPPYLAKAAKKVWGADFLIQNNYNMSEANEEYGQGWLTK
jgi:hypothetical protein